MLIDAFEPEGITRLAKDSIFMMPHLGVLAQVHPRAAMEVFERDCLIYLGTCIAPKGTGKAGQPCCKYQFTGGVQAQGEAKFGELLHWPLGVGETANVVLEPARGFDVGSGPGKRHEATIHGGTVGVIFDARGRSLVLPEERQRCQQQVQQWNKIVEMYP